MFVSVEKSSGALEGRGGLLGELAGTDGVEGCDNEHTSGKLVVQGGPRLLDLLQFAETILPEVALTVSLVASP